MTAYSKDKYVPICHCRENMGGPTLDPRSAMPFLSDTKVLLSIVGFDLDLGSICICLVIVVCLFLCFFLSFFL